MNLATVLSELSRYRPLTAEESSRLRNAQARIDRMTLSPATHKIVSKAARDHGVSVREIMGRSRIRPIAWARQQIMSDLAARGWSEPRIGNFLKRDHSTVHVGIKAHRARQAAP